MREGCDGLPRYITRRESPVNLYTYKIKGFTLHTYTGCIITSVLGQCAGCRVKTTLHTRHGLVDNFDHASGGLASPTNSGQTS